MSVPRRTLPVLFAAGLVPATLALALPAPPPTALQHAPPPTAPRVARLLDSIAQSRFQDVSMQTFGLSRMGPEPERHLGVSFMPRNPQEAKALRAAEAGGNDYVIDFFHCAPVPPGPPPSFSTAGGQTGTPFGMEPRVGGFGGRVGGSGTTPRLLPASVPTDSLTSLVLHSQTLTPAAPGVASLQTRLRSEALEALPKLRAGKEVQSTRAGWTVLMRPVVAAQASCLSCHTAARKNDTLGVMVYAVHDSPGKF